MSDNVRFHSKGHAKAHHTTAVTGYYDSATDPIASAGSPFMGNFDLSGSHIYYDASVAADTSITIGYSEFVNRYEKVFTTVKVNSGSWTATGNSKWSVASNNLYPQTLSNNLGLGTADAIEKLTVSGNISASGGLSALGGVNYFGGDVGIGTANPVEFASAGLAIKHASYAQIGLGVDNDNRAWLSRDNGLFQIGTRESGTSYSNTIVCKTGNVGLGTAAPGHLLDVRKDQNAATVSRVYNNTSGTAALTRHVIESNNNYLHLSVHSPLHSSTPDEAIINMVGADTLKFSSGGTPLMTLLDTGKFGIGTTLPNHELTVVGDISATGTIHGIVPAGAITQYAGSTAPTGWLLCDGSTVSRTTYSDLFAVTSTTYGVGDGASTFALPDLRGRAAFGVDAMNNSVGTGGGAASRLTGASTLGAVSGAETHTLIEGQLATHDHDLRTYATPNNHNAANGGPPEGSDQTNYPGAIVTMDAIQDAGGGNPHQNMPPYIVLTYIIKT